LLTRDPQRLLNRRELTPRPDTAPKLQARLAHLQCTPRWPPQSASGKPLARSGRSPRRLRRPWPPFPPLDSRPLARIQILLVVDHCDAIHIHVIDEEMSGSRKGKVATMDETDHPFEAGNNWIMARNRVIEPLGDFKSDKTRPLKNTATTRSPFGWNRRKARPVPRN